MKTNLKKICKTKPETPKPKPKRETPKSKPETSKPKPEKRINKRKLKKLEKILMN